MPDSKLVQLLEKIERNTRAGGGRGGGGGGGRGGGGGGGGGAGGGLIRPSGIPGMLSSKIGEGLAGRLGGGLAARAAGGALAGAVTGGLALGAAAVAVGGAAVGGGLVNQSRGGTFQGGVQSSLNSLAAGIPILGELQGFSGAQRIEQGMAQDLGAITDQIARFAGADAIPDETRAFLADVTRQQQTNIEENRQRNLALSKDASGDIARSQGGGAAALADSIDRLAEIFGEFSSKVGTGVHR